MNPEQALPACAGGPCEAQVPSRPCRRAHKASGGNSKRFGAALGARHSFNGISRSCPHCKHRRHSPSSGARSVNSRQPSCLPRSRCLRRPPGSKKWGRKTFFWGGRRAGWPQNFSQPDNDRDRAGDGAEGSRRQSRSVDLTMSSQCCERSRRSDREGGEMGKGRTGLLGIGVWICPLCSLLPWEPSGGTRGWDAARCQLPGYSPNSRGIR